MIGGHCQEKMATGLTFTYDNFIADTFEVSLQKDDATVLDLKSELDEEYGLGDANRLSLYYFGVLLDDDLRINDIVSDGLGGNCFAVALPKASQSVPPERFLLVGKDRKFKEQSVETFLGCCLFHVFVAPQPNIKELPDMTGYFGFRYVKHLVNH